MSKSHLPKFVALSVSVVACLFAAGCAETGGDDVAAAHDAGDAEGASAGDAVSEGAAEEGSEPLAAFPFPFSKPNLVPVQVNAGAGFCTFAGGKLLVRIKNAGKTTAPASNTMVNFGQVRDHRGATPALAPGATFDLLFAVPSGCFSPDCFFSIVADENGAVSESSESDNVASGACVG